MIDPSELAANASPTRPFGPLISSSAPFTHFAPSRGPLKSSQPTTTFPSPETPLARVDLPVVLPGFTTPVDSSHRNARATSQPSQPRPTTTRPSPLTPSAELRS